MKIVFEIPDKTIERMINCFNDDLFKHESEVKKITPEDFKNCLIKGIEEDVECWNWESWSHLERFNRLYRVFEDHIIELPICEIRTAELIEGRDSEEEEAEYERDYKKIYGIL